LEGRDSTFFSDRIDTVTLRIVEDVVAIADCGQGRNPRTLNHVQNDESGGKPGYHEQPMVLLVQGHGVVGKRSSCPPTTPLPSVPYDPQRRSAFGFKPGTDRKLADWNELIAYFKKLSAESNRIRYEELGKTTEGRPFIAVTISSADNLAHLDR
jgi:hypothetical protein